MDFFSRNVLRISCLVSCLLFGALGAQAQSTLLPKGGGGISSIAISQYTLSPSGGWVVTSAQFSDFDAFFFLSSNQDDYNISGHENEKERISFEIVPSSSFASPWKIAFSIEANESVEAWNSKSYLTYPSFSLEELNHPDFQSCSIAAASVFVSKREGSDPLDALTFSSGFLCKADTYVMITFDYNRLDQRLCQLKAQELSNNHKDHLRVDSLIKQAILGVKNTTNILLGIATELPEDDQIQPGSRIGLACSIDTLRNAYRNSRENFISQQAIWEELFDGILNLADLVRAVVNHGFCAEGQVRDPNSGECLCPEGQSLINGVCTVPDNLEQIACEQEGGAYLGGKCLFCKQGEIADADTGTCVCEAGKVWIGPDSIYKTGLCVDPVPGLTDERALRHSQYCKNTGGVCITDSCFVSTCACPGARMEVYSRGESYIPGYEECVNETVVPCDTRDWWRNPKCYSNGTVSGQ